MEFFNKVFNWIEQLSAKVGSFNVEAYFFIVLGIILAIGIIIGFTFFDSTRYKILRASKRIINYLKEVDNVDDDNVAEFTERCFSEDVPKSLRDTWVEFLGVRFGYPSEIISQQNVYDKEVQKADNMRPSIFLTIGLILTGLFAFFGYGALEKTGMSVILFLGLVLVALIYIVLVIITKSLNKKSLNTFYEMQEDIDAKVNLPIETNYSTDGSPLNEAASIIDEIIAKNMSRDVESGYEEVVADMGDTVKLNPVEKKYVLRKDPVYVAPEYNAPRVIPTVPKIKRFLTTVKEEPVAQEVKEEPVVENVVEQELPKVEEKPKEEKKTSKKRISKKAKAVEKKVVEEKVEPVVETKPEEVVEETPVETIPERSISEFDDAAEIVMPVAAPVEMPEQKEKTKEIEENKVDEYKPMTLEERSEQEPVGEVDPAENVSIEKVEEEKVEDQVDNKAQEAPVEIPEETPVAVEEGTPGEEEVEIEPIPEIHLQTISNDDAEETPEELQEEKDMKTEIGQSFGIKDIMSTDAFGSSVLGPKTEEDNKKKKSKKKK